MNPILIEEIVKLSTPILGLIISFFTGTIAFQNYKENNGKLFIQGDIVLQENKGAFLKITIFNIGKRPVFIKYCGLEFWDSLNAIISDNKQINKTLNEADSVEIFEQVNFDEIHKIKNAFIVDHRNKYWRIDYMDFIYDVSHYDKTPTKLYRRNKKIQDVKLYFRKRKYRKTIIKLGRIPKNI
ncbi:hypothetical protein [Chryseobacterium sp. MP_3.2]|uniref:hypothetical protein n=1 Tax=Chryseobacterium sp. MP_3.2 TaxID=3071712 RepID=UPI002E04D696|nr:hypothetical protein [Chryseobacterium sp. MP_3.2]